MPVLRILLTGSVLTGLLACHPPLRVPDDGPPYPLREVDRESFLLSFGPELDEPAGSPGGQDDRLRPDRVRQLAVANHPDVIAARSRVAEAKARWKTAGTWPNPELEGRLLVGTDGEPGGEAALLFSLPLGGRIGRAEEEALVSLDLARLDLQSARRSALLEAERWLVGLSAARARLALLEGLAEKSRKYASLARARREASVADPLDVALILSDAARDRREVARARAAVESVEKKLRLVLGLEPGKGEFEPPSLARVRLLDSKSELASSLLEHNPDVARAWLTVLEADRAAARTAAERWPDLEVGPAMLAEEGRLGVGVMLGLPLPIFNTRRGPYDEALARRDAALSGYRSAIRKATSRLGVLLDRLRSREEELQQLVGDVADALEMALTLAEVRYQTGKLDVLRLLLVHRAFSSQKLDYLELLREQRLVLLELEKLSGRPLKTEEVVP